MNRGPGRSAGAGALNRGLCILGAAGALAGILLGHNPLFLVGIGIGVPGYLGVRRELRRDLESGKKDDPATRE